jgi:hypothetical protein
VELDSPLELNRNTYIPRGLACALVLFRFTLFWGREFEGVVCLMSMEDRIRCR